MQVKSIHHIAVAVSNVDEALVTYQQLFGASFDHRETVPDQGVDAAMVILGGNRIELLGATGPDTPVGKFLAKRGPGIHHIAFEVDDIRASLAELEAKGAQLIDTEPGADCTGSRSPSSTRKPLLVSSTSWWQMPDKDKVRVEVGFDGGQIMNSLVASDSATALEEAIGKSGTSTVTLESSEGPLIVVLAHVAYVKRHTRGGQVGFLNS